MKVKKVYESIDDINLNVPNWITEQLVNISVNYINFSGDIKSGNIICNTYIADDLKIIFNNILKLKFNIEKINPISLYDWNDDKSAKVNNTHCFNYRNVLGINKLSDHSLGMAIDINPMQNPWIHPRYGNLPEGSDYDIYKKGTITDNIANVFKGNGFLWGGDWNNPDYQHFYKKI